MKSPRAFETFWRDVATRFRVDPDRVIVNGLSQTGFWSWYLARTNPRRFAAILPMSAVTWQVDAYASNFLALPIGVLHGSDDPTCPCRSRARRSHCSSDSAPNACAT
jgi:predicted peptidase